MRNTTNCTPTTTVATLSRALTMPTMPVVSVPSTPAVAVATIPSMWRERSFVPAMGSGLGFAATGHTTVNHNSIAAKAGVSAVAKDRRYAAKQAAPPRGERH